MSLSKLTPEWLRQVYEVDLLSVSEIAEQAGCSIPNIRKRLKDWDIKRGKTAIVGKPSWNAGKTKETDESMRRVSEAKMGDKNPMFGKQPWNEGLTKENDERMAVISEKMTGRDVSEETRAKQSAAKQGKRRAETNHYRSGVCIFNGYEAVLKGTDVSGRSVYEYTHRVVASKTLGRALLDDEHIHHCDMEKLNKDPDNLLVIAPNAHTALHAAMHKGDSCWTKKEQKSWLENNGFSYEEVK